MLFFIFILIIFLVIYAAEQDRNFAYLDTIEDYYISQPARFLLGTVNTVVRSTHHHVPFPDINHHFPEHQEFLDNFALIRQEALQIYREQGDLIPSFGDIDKGFATIADEKWKSFVILWYNGLTNNAALAPITSGLVDKHPKILAAMFSILAPGTRIPMHKGPSCLAIRYHLCLSLPEEGEAKIEVDGNWVVYEEGKDYFFCDDFKHRVEVNAPTHCQPRIVLFLDVLRQCHEPIHTVVKFLNSQAKVADFVKGVNAKAELRRET